MDKQFPFFKESKLYLFGINAIVEALKKPNVEIEAIYFSKESSNPRVISVLEEIERKKIPAFLKDEIFFTSFGNHVHQSLIAILKKQIPIFEEMQSVETFLKNKTEAVILALDKITDPHNLGAISRSAYFFGVDLILMEKKDSAPLNATVHKVSSGASLLMNYALIHSLRLSLEHLRELGFNIYVAETDGVASQAVHQTHFEKPLCLVLGSEGKGIRKNLLAKEDKKIHIQGKTDFDSLNVSVATSIILHTIRKD